MIKGGALRASAFHFLFHAEGRVTPGRLLLNGIRAAERKPVWPRFVAGERGGRLEFLLLWPDGRVAPGWAFCLVTFA